MNTYRAKKRGRNSDPLSSIHRVQDNFQKLDTIVNPHTNQDPTLTGTLSQRQKHQKLTLTPKDYKHSQTAGKEEAQMNIDKHIHVP